MDFSNPAETQALLAKAQSFAENELIPPGPKLQGHGWYAIEFMLQEKRQNIRALCLWAPNLPKSLGAAAGRGMRQ